MEDLCITFVASLQKQNWATVETQLIYAHILDGPLVSDGSTMYTAVTAEPPFMETSYFGAVPRCSGPNRVAICRCQQRMRLKLYRRK